MSAPAQKITYTATPEQIEAMHGEFDEALEAIKADYGATYPMIINGEEITGRETFDVRPPADRTIVLGSFQKGTTEDVDRAVAAANAAFPDWSGRPWRARVDLVRKAAELIRERKYRLSAFLIHETRQVTR